jgi:hypothetical protein
MIDVGVRLWWNIGNLQERVALDLELSSEQRKLEEQPYLFMVQWRGWL